MQLCGTWQVACWQAATRATGQRKVKRGCCAPVPPCNREDIFKEIDIVCGLHHENVVFLKEYFEEGNKVGCGCAGQCARRACKRLAGCMPRAQPKRAPERAESMGWHGAHARDDIGHSLGSRAREGRRWPQPRLACTRDRALSGAWARMHAAGVPDHGAGDGRRAVGGGAEARDVQRAGGAQLFRAADAGHHVPAQPQRGAP